MPVSKKRKKEGKPVHRKAPAEQPAGSEQADSPQAHPDAHGGKPKNPFVSQQTQQAQQSQRRGAQRGR